MHKTLKQQYEVNETQVTLMAIKFFRYRFFPLRPWLWRLSPPITQASQEEFPPDTMQDTIQGQRSAHQQAMATIHRVQAAYGLERRTFL